MRSYVDGVCRFLLAFGVIALCLAGQAGAVTVTLEASQDNTLYQNDMGGLSNGAGEHFFAGRNGGAGGAIILRGLLMFDIASRIPPGSVINSVTLNLTATTPMLHTGTVTLHSVLQAWGEGTSDAGMGEAGGAPSTPGSATWIHTRFDTELWTMPGGDFTPEASASLAVAANGPQEIATTPGLVGDVQGWVDDPESNNGWLLRLGDEAALAVRFASRNNANPDLRPRLTVDFSLPPMLISPPSGIYAQTQAVDIVVFANLPEGVTVTGVTAFLDGVDVSATLGACLLAGPGTVSEGGQTFRCPDQSVEGLVPGTHTFEAVLALSDGMMMRQAVTWIIVPNTEP